jgi:predicted nuclease of restriction endonuclease-like (RecB) superfamily
MLSSEGAIDLFHDVTKLIEEARNHVAREYNSAQVLLCWLIGERINDRLLQSDRADYGEMVVSSLAVQLKVKYGKGYSRANLFRMIKFAKLYPDRKIVSTLSRQLSWSHFVIICGIDDHLKRDFFAEMCRIQKWSVRALQKQINGMLYERVGLSKQPEGVIKSQISQLKNNDEMTPEMTFKEPYFLDFIGAHFYASEQELEDLILQNITEFLQEIGTDFCFVSRQKRMSTGKKDRYLDLLFFNRRLRRLIAIDLKLGDFDPAYKGQMEWYLNWLDKNERLDYEEKPMGIILCAGKDHDDIEYLEMDKTGIHVAQYLTELPPKEILEDNLRKAIATARETHIKRLLLEERHND